MACKVYKHKSKMPMRMTDLMKGKVSNKKKQMMSNLNLRL